ncbi:MAG: PLP-dependent aminotransferase family protein [Alphaproteobacteria bacterium]|nr:PLP-dependent aminotransferase family protein [Alphaproteobacteria bacterium]
MSNNPYRLDWVPTLPGEKKNISIALADAIAADIRNGRLKAGQKLPPQRLLAYTMGLNLGTVHKAYKTAAKRRLIAGEVGRGSFVRDDARNNILWPNENPYARAIDFCDNFPCPIRKTDPFQRALNALAKAPNLSQLLQYQQNSARDDHKALGAAWIGRFGVKAEPPNVLIANGAIHAGFISLCSLCRPGDTIVTEALTSQAIKGTAETLNLRLKGAAMDKEGVIPEALEEILRTNKVSAVYLAPTLHNPTASTLPSARRRRIAALLDKHGVSLIEDDTFAPLLDKAIQPLSSFIPERSFYIAGLSKALAPGLRLAFLKAPTAFYQNALDILRLTTWLASPLLIELAGRLLVTGEAEAVIRQHRRDIAARQDIAKRVLKGYKAVIRPGAPHIWLPLPDPWRAAQFKEALAKREVNALSSDAFAVNRNNPVHAVRLCLGTPPSLAVVTEGLRIVKETLLRR